MVDTCAVIPVFEHGQTVGRVVDAVRNCGLHVVLVDDGSAADCARVLDAIAQDADDVHLLRHPLNRGKGAAVQTGLRSAAALGYSHALQVDADGQHALGDIPRFLAESRSLPEAVVCGRPVFGADAPSFDTLVLGPFVLEKERQPAWKETSDWKQEFQLD